MPARRWPAAACALAGALAGVLSLGCSATPSPAEPGDCEVCRKPLVAGATVVAFAQDDILHRYRCVHCALGVFGPGGEDFSLVAPTPSGEDVRVVRRGGVLSVEPESAVFLILPETGGECLDRHKAFRDEAALRDYVAAHGGLGEVAPRAWTIGELDALLAAGRAR